MAKSYRGKEVDMQRVALENQKTIAIGNVKYNARGDLLGKGGKIEKTREEMIKEYYEASPTVESKVSLVSPNTPTVDVTKPKNEAVPVASKKPSKREKQTEPESVSKEG